jgi:hypothetical protein
VPSLTLKDVESLNISQCPGLPDTHRDQVKDGQL